MGAHPVLDFPVYGLVTELAVPQWVEIIEGQVGEPIWGVWLAYGTYHDENPTPSLRVGVSSQSRYAEIHRWSNTRPEAVYVADLWRVFRNFIDGDSTRNESFGDLDFIIEDSPPVSGFWKTVQWTVNGQPLAARALVMGRSWVAYAMQDHAVWIAAMGKRAGPSDLRFEPTDGHEYGVDFRKQLEFPRSLIESRSRLNGNT